MKIVDCLNRNELKIVVEIEPIIKEGKRRAQGAEWHTLEMDWYGNEKPTVDRSQIFTNMISNQTNIVRMRGGSKNEK